MLYLQGVEEMRTQGCRDQIDWVQLHCHGLSKEAVSEVKFASKFCKEHAPYLELQTTKSVNAIRTIKDPIIQGRVLEMVKHALDEKADPRTGDKFSKNTVGAITTPMIKWMIEYAGTGIKPAYVPRGQHVPREELNGVDVLPLIDEIITCKLDRKIGQYLISEELMTKIKTFREVHTCNPASR